MTWRHSWHRWRKFRASTIAAIIILSVLIPSLLPLPKVLAAAPTNVQITTGNSSAVVYGTNLNFNADIYADKVEILSNQVNFTNIAYSSNSNPTQSFGVAQCCSSTGVSNALNNIKSDHVEFQLTFTSGTPKLYFYYIMPSGIGFNVPQTVLHIYQTSTAAINDGSYYTDATAFSNCLAPCVFQNTANKTLVIKSISSSPVTIDVYYPVFSQGGGGPIVTTTTTAAVGGGEVAGSQDSVGGGGGGGFSLPPPITNGTITPPAIAPIAEVPNFLGIGIIGIMSILGLSVFISALRERGIWREPKVVKSAFREPSRKRGRFRSPKS